MSSSESSELFKIRWLTNGRDCFGNFPMMGSRLLTIDRFIFCKSNLTPNFIYEKSFYLSEYR